MVSFEKQNSSIIFFYIAFCVVCKESIKRLPMRFVPVCFLKLTDKTDNLMVKVSENTTAPYLCPAESMISDSYVFPFWS